MAFFDDVLARHYEGMAETKFKGRAANQVEAIKREANATADPDAYTRAQLQQLLNNDEDVERSWRWFNKARKQKGLPTLTLQEYINARKQDLVDNRPYYAKPFLDRFDPNSEEYAQWQNTVDQWEAEDEAKAQIQQKYQDFTQNFLQKYREAQQEMEYRNLLDNFAKNYTAQHGPIDTTPQDIRWFV